jgi:acyl carrier protein
VTPASDVERRIAAIWEDALGIEQLGVHDSFFELGGNSLAAAEVIARVKKEFDVQLSVATLFEGPTIRALARIVDAGSGDEAVVDLRFDRGRRRRERTVSLD